MEQLPSIEKSAHRTEVRCLAFSSDDMLIASGSAESLKIWNRLVMNFVDYSCVNYFRHSCESIRTIPCAYALCCMFLPGDHLVLIGCKVREEIVKNWEKTAGWDYRMDHCK